MRIAGASDDSEKRRAVNKVIEGLRGDAFDLAMDVGLARLMEDGGLAVLIALIRKTIFPIEAQEAKVLFALGQKPYGPMTRQPTESMVSYSSRRRRWWNMVTKLDSKMVLSDEMLGSLLLDHSGLSAQEGLMVLTSTGNVTAFDKIKEVLILQHSRIHMSSRSGAKGKEKGQQPWSGYRPKGHGGKGKYSYLAGQTLEEWPETYADHEQDEWYETAWVADSSSLYHYEHEDWTSPCVYQAYAPEDLDLDTFDDMLLQGCGEEEAVAALQDEADEWNVAHFGYKGKGKSKGKKGKGKGKNGQTSFPMGKGKPAPTLDERKKRLAEIKSRTKCRVCGQTGHWAGDSACSGNHTAHVAFACREIEVEENDYYSFAHTAVAVPLADQTADKICRRACDGDQQWCNDRCSRHQGHTGEHLCTTCTRTPAREPEDSEQSDVCFMAYSTKSKKQNAPSKQAPEEFDMSADDEDLYDDPEELDATSSSNDNGPPGFDKIFDAGQHKGSTYLHVALNVNGYASWGKRSKKPSLTLSNFLAWFDKYYVETEDGGAKRRTSGDRRVPVSDSGPSKKKPPNPPLPQKCSKCVDFDGTGSSGRYIVRTCRGCGHRTKEERHHQTEDPSTCPHSTVDHRGSARGISRTFCTQCLTYIDEEPMENRQKKKNLAEELENATISKVDAVDRLLKHDRMLDPNTLKSVLRVFKHNATVIARDTGHVYSSELVTVLQDAIASLADETPDTALMATGECATGCSILDKLRRVDIYQDKGVWATLDEGCNSNCHGRAWARNAEDKFELMGLFPEWVHHQKKSYNGVGGGDASTIGKKKFPYSIVGTTSRVSGCLESHELGDADHVPLLLSLPAQSKLGLCKDLAKGTCRLGDDGDVELCRDNKSGLLVIRIDHFAGFELPKTCIPLHISYAAYLTSSSEEETKTSFPARKRAAIPADIGLRPCPKQRSAPVAEAMGTTMICTVGLENFETHPDGDRSTSVHDHLGQYYQGKSSGLSVDDNEYLIKEALKKSRPSLFRGRRIVLVDCRALMDPHKTGHIGLHPDILRATVKNRHFESIAKKIAGGILDAEERGLPFVIATICRSGRHRSVAVAAIIGELLHTRGHKWVTTHLSDHEWAARTCGGRCDECSFRTASASASAEESIRIGCAIIKDAIDKSDVAPGQAQKKPRHEQAAGSKEPLLSGDDIRMMVTDHIRDFYKRVNPAKDDLDRLLAKYRNSE